MAVHAVHAVHRNAGTAGTARGVQTARSNELLGHNAKNLLFRDFLVIHSLPIWIRGLLSQITLEGLILCRGLNVFRFN